MKYVPRQPREGINVSDTHPLVEAGTLVVGLTAIFVTIVVLLIFLIEVVLYFVPAEKEAALFRDWLPNDLITVSPADERLEQTHRPPLAFSSRPRRWLTILRGTGPTHPTSFAWKSINPTLPTQWRCPGG